MLYAKAEHLNMTGSIKDRMALHILKKANDRGALQDDTTIIEASSGNTAISFAAIGRALGYPVVIFMPESTSDERKNLVRGLGADVRLVGKADGGFLGCLQRADEMAAQLPNAFQPHQFSNEDDCAAHYQTTGSEIWWQLRTHSIIPDAFVAGIGTGGTVMGVGRLLAEKYPSIRIHPLEPESCPILSKKQKTGTHRIQGICDEFVPAVVKLEELDQIISVNDGDSICMAQKLASQIGLGVGISSGYNFLGALIAQNQLGKDATVVTVFPDDNKKYLSTDLLRHESVHPDYLSKDVELLEFSAIKRVCYTCWNPDDTLEFISL